MHYLVWIHPRVSYFLAAFEDNTNPEQRVKRIGVFRLWDDLGYAIRALLTVLLEDFFGLGIYLADIDVLTVIWLRISV